MATSENKNLSPYQKHKMLNSILMGNLVEVPEYYYPMYGLEAEGTVADLMLKKVLEKAKAGSIVLPDEQEMLQSICEENGVAFDQMQKHSENEWVSPNQVLRVKRRMKMAYYEDVNRNLIAGVKTVFECTIHALQAYTVIVNHELLTLVELDIPKEDEIEAARGGGGAAA